MVQEAKLEEALCALVTDVYWDRDDFWIRLADDKCGADCADVASLLVYLINTILHLLTM
jgi:hypothetical protein